MTSAAPCLPAGMDDLNPKVAVGPPTHVPSVAQLQARYRTRRAIPPAPSPATHDAGGRLNGRATDDGNPCAELTLPAGWIAVMGAAAGAGTSTVALAIADAAATCGPAHLVETAPPGRSGLAGAPDTELGVDDGDTWRHGARGLLLIDRPAGPDKPEAWPAGPGGPLAVTVVDVGAALSQTGLAAGEMSVRTVLVCRATVPGVAQAERLLTKLPVAGALLVAAIGPCRWPRLVTLTCGPLLRALRNAGRVIAVPLDRRLEVTGVTSRPLPRRVRVAGRDLATLLDATPTDTQAVDPIDDTAITPVYPCRKPAGPAVRAHGSHCGVQLASAAAGRS